MIKKREAHEFAGKTVRIKTGKYAGADYRLEDWWVNVNGKSWMDCDGNLACIQYAVRSEVACIPCDDEVVYGKIGELGYLIHASEIGELIRERKEA